MKLIEAPSVVRAQESMLFGLQPFPLLVFFYSTIGVLITPLPPPPLDTLYSSAEFRSLEQLCCIAEHELIGKCSYSLASTCISFHLKVPRYRRITISNLSA
jgi:hypothetical protein